MEPKGPVAVYDSGSGKASETFGRAVAAGFFLPRRQVGFSHLTLFPQVAYDESAMTTKVIDKKGRLALGNRFAGRMVIIDDTDPDRIVITPAVAIPAKEAWLYQNQEALDLLRTGLKQARARKFSTSPPNLGAKWIAELED